MSQSLIPHFLNSNNRSGSVHSFSHIQTPSVIISNIQDSPRSNRASFTITSQGNRRRISNFALSQFVGIPSNHIWGLSNNFCFHFSTKKLNSVQNRWMESIIWHSTSTIMTYSFIVNKGPTHLIVETVRQCYAQCSKTRNILHIVCGHQQCNHRHWCQDPMI